MKEQYNIQHLEISKNWKVVRNVFFDINPIGNESEEVKYDYIYCQEDLLYLTKGNYHLDLGWYGNDDLANERTGYCIHLYRGNDWNNGELLEKHRSKDKQVIVEKINELIKSVDKGNYDNITGYIVDENDIKNENAFNDMDSYSAR